MLVSSYYLSSKRKGNFELKTKVLSRIVLTLLLTSILTSTFNIQPAKAEPATITVPEDYPTIKEAINAASSGDTIVVQEGLYAEGGIFVYKPLTLIADGKVIVDGLHTAFSVFDVAASGVVIKGFTVRNGMYLGISLEGGWGWQAHNCKIEGNTVTNNPIGIQVEGSSNIISGNKVLNNSVTGISLFSGPCHPTAKYNILKENIVEDNDWGIFLWDTHCNILKENTVASNDGFGIGLLVSHNNLIQENKVTNNFDGIILSGSGGNTVEQNKVKRNTSYGIA